MTAPIPTSCGWHEDGAPGDSTTICPECLERYFPEPKLLPMRASPARVPLPCVFDSKSEAAKAFSMVGCVWALLLLVAYLGVEVVMARVFP